jgi:hypothetical protein
MSGGERPGYIATRYNDFVVQRITSIYNPDSGGPRWEHLGDAQGSPPLVSLEIPDGNKIKFDISFKLRSSGFGKRNIILMVETKCSYDQSTIDTGFKSFLENVFSVEPGVRKMKKDGIEYFFAFIAPISPNQNENLTHFKSSEDIINLSKIVSDRVVTPEEIDSLRDHLFILILAQELNIIWGEDNHG